MLYTFDRLCLNDYFLYSDLKIPLADQGAVLVKGKNGSGKSLLFSGISLLLQGVIGNNKIPKKVMKLIDLNMSCNYKKDYIVALEKNNFKLLEQGVEITKHKKPEAMAQIKSLFPEENLFNSSSYVSQFSPIYNSLIGGSPAIRMSVIESFVDRSKVDQIKSTLLLNKKECDKSISELESVRTQIAFYTDKQPRFKDTSQLKTKATELHCKIKDIKSLALELQSQTKKYKDYNQQKKKIKTKKSIPVLKKELTTLKESIDSLEYKLLTHTDESVETWLSWGHPELYEVSDVRYIDEEYDFTYVKKKDAVKTVALANKLRTQLESASLILKKLSKLEGKKSCPTCLQAISIKEFKKIISSLEKDKKKLQSKFNLLKSKLYSIQEMNRVAYAFEGIDICDVDFTCNVSQLKKEIRTKQKEVDVLQEQISLLEVFSSMTPVDKPKKGLSKYRKTLDEMEEKYYEIRENLATQSSDNKSYKKIKRELKELKATEKKLLNKTKDVDKISPLLKSFSSRELRTEIIRGFAETLVDEWNVYAHDLFQKKVYFTLKIEGGLPAFYFSFDRKSEGVDIKYASGGERKRIISCMVPSILKVSPTKTNILIVDELDANMDEEGVECLLNFFPKLLAKEFGKTSLFFITARQKLVDQNYNTWLVKRQNNKATLHRG